MKSKKPVSHKGKRRKQDIKTKYKRIVKGIIAIYLLTILIALLFLFVADINIFTLNKKNIELGNQVDILTTLVNTLNEKIKELTIKNDELTTSRSQSTSRVSNAVTPTPSVEITDRELLARLLWTEGRGESIECQRAIVSVVINRVNSGYWGSSISSVIKAPGQFDLGNKLDNVKPSQTQYDVVDYVLANGVTLPSSIIYFRANYYHDWATDYCSIDNTYFSSK